MNGPLNQQWQEIATGPCRVTFVNSSRMTEILQIRCQPGPHSGSSKYALREIEPAHQASVTIAEPGQKLEARQRRGKSITWEVSK
jgi:hypothetical protein